MDHKHHRMAEDIAKSMPQTLQFVLFNVHCASCVETIETVLKNVPDVKKAEVNFAARTLQVETSLSPDEIIHLVESVGYSAQLLVDRAQQSKQALREYHQLLKKALVAGVIGLTLLIIGWNFWAPDLNTTMGRWHWFILGGMTLIGLIYAGGYIYLQAWKSLLKRHATMDTLIAVGTGAAFLFSMVMVAFPDIVPPLARHVYFEVAIIIIVFVDLGAALEMRARGKTSQAIERLFDLQVKVVHVIRDEQELTIPIEQVLIDDIVKIYPGEKIATDGEIIEGKSSVDESMLTGESIPVLKQIGDKVIGGTINKTGSFLFKVTRVGGDTVLAQIIRLVERAQNTKPPIGRLADQIAGIFVPIVIVIAVLTAFIWLLIGPSPQIGFMLVTFMTVLVIACPCALGLATPISIIAGVGKAAEYGVLIKNGEALQRAIQLTTIVFDKTGTVTKGEPEITSIHAFNPTSEKTLLQYAASLEANSEHPLASAILQKAKQKNISLLPIQDFQSVTGKGISAVINNQKVFLGNELWMQQHHVAISGLIARQAKVLTRSGQAIMFLAVNDQAQGIIAVSDPIKSNVKSAIKKLQSLGLKLVMLTGDHEVIANRSAKQIGIEHVIAEVLPQDKLKHIQALQQQGEIVGMVGDGINDAPALAQANVGFAISAGTDVAIESADITLMRNTIDSVFDAVMISKATMRNIKQNLFWAFIYNILAIPVAAGILYPFVGLLLNPMIASFAMAMSSVTVVINANRLRFYKTI